MLTNPENMSGENAPRVSFNGATIPVEIELEDGAEMSPLQQEALRLLQSLPDDVLETSAPAIVQNYEVYREMIGDEECPPLENPVDVWKQVAPTYFRISPHENESAPTFFLLAECDWDPEHGLVVRFRDGVADESNQQGEM